MKKKYIIIPLLVFILIVSIVFIKISYSDTNTILSSKEYTISNNTIKAIPTSLELTVGEFLSKIDYGSDYSDIKIYDKNNNELNYNSLIGTGSTLKVNNSTYNIAVAGDLTGEGTVNLGDVSKLYNAYKGKTTLTGAYLNAGRVTNSSGLSLGDVSKIYNFFKKKSALSYYSYDPDKLDEESIEKLTQEKINEIRNTPNTDYSHRDQSKIFYVSNDGYDNNDGKSPDRPIQTLGRIAYYMNQGVITKGSTVLFRDGDTFKGTLVINQDDILFGSYGDISKGKPILSKSEHDGAKEGTWVNVKGNIWKYTLNDSDKVFEKNVGTIWFFCNKGNNNCSHSMTSLDKTFDYAQMITTYRDHDETNIVDEIDTLLTHDLEFYHVGHAYNAVTSGKELYLYSIGNPADRFDEIEFNQGGHNIGINGHNDIYVDNLKIMYTGSHGIGGSTMSNLVVTNCEIGFIGGMVQNYNNNKPTRYGNAVEIYGSVRDYEGSTVKDGMIVDHNYIYQCYDAGPTFQLSAKVDTGTVAIMEKARYSNNVLEYSNYNIEYWMSTDEDEGEIFDVSTIHDFTVENNILRYSGYGLCETRPDKGGSAHIKTWYHENGSYNRIVGNIKIRNNIFYKQREQAYYFRTNRHSDRYPILLNNTFYGMYGDNFGYTSNEKYANLLKFNDVLLETENYPGNRFIILNKDEYHIQSDSGITGSATWNFNLNNYTLTISGNGDMADYSESNLPPWYKYKDYIYNIKIDENVTYLGKYAFYNLFYVKEFRINAINLKDLAVNPSNPNWGDNYTTYDMGNSTKGTTVIIGPKVTRIPKMLFKPMEDYNNHSYYKSVIFEGDKLTTISNYGLAFYRGPALAIPETVTSLGGLSLGYNSAYIMILPDSLKSVPGWSLSGNSKMEKLVYGETVETVGESMFNGYTELKTLVIPKINKPDVFNENTFGSVTQVVDVYGDSSTKTWLDHHIEEYNRTNLIYHDINTYKSKVTSNTGINAEVGYNKSYEFTTNKSVKAYYKYINKDGKEILFDGVNITKNGNTYTINKIKNDIYLEIK